MMKALILFFSVLILETSQAKVLLSEKLNATDSEILFNMLETMVESQIMLTPFSHQETRTFITSGKEFSIRCKANKLAEFGYQDHTCLVRYQKNPYQMNGVELTDGPLASAKIVQIDSVKEGSRLFNRVLKGDHEFRSTEKVPFRLLNGRYTSFPFLAIDCEEVSIMHPELAKCQVSIVPRV